MQKLYLAEDIYDQLKENKRCTIRKGHRNISLGYLTLESADIGRQTVVDVHSILVTKLKDVPVEYVINDGFDNHQDLLDVLQRYYEDITMDSQCTVIAFEVV